MLTVYLSLDAFLGIVNSSLYIDNSHKIILDKVMPRKLKRTKRRTKKLQVGHAGNIFVFGIVGLTMIVAAVTVGGFKKSPILSNNEEIVKVISPSPDIQHNNLQLQTFGFITIAPTPQSYGNLCQAGGVNNEPEILVGYSPAAGETISQTGQIKVWVNDEGAPFVAPNEQVNLTTGEVTLHGDTTAKAPDNFLYEPALYIAPNTADSANPAPHFPDFVKGQFNNNPPKRDDGIKGAPIDPVPAGSKNDLEYTAEYIWNVASLGLSPGSHEAQFVIHDGDRDRGIGCISIQIQ